MQTIEKENLSVNDIIEASLQTNSQIFKITSIQWFSLFDDPNFRVIGNIIIENKTIKFMGFELYLEQ